MASVAEFYSRNLANEILRGTVQKAETADAETRAAGLPQTSSASSKAATFGAWSATRAAAI
jgi:hypothetical protein